ncbi:hypothetical protein MHBO_002352 [Bonamia ostreae]|uniref:Uncharacterized protein n=1 Tax=Bonamia ostreae TaxID=126728 RepID=A0ABV2AMH1_9EUKA
MEHKANHLEKAQQFIWKIRKKRLKLEMEGKSVRTQLEYWTKRKQKLDLEKTPNIIRNLEKAVQKNEIENNLLEKNYQGEKSKANEFKKRFLQQTDGQLNSINDPQTKSNIALKLKNKIERLEWRDEIFEKMLDEQHNELEALKNNEDVMKMHLGALFEAVCFQKAFIESVVAFGRENNKIIGDENNKNKKIVRREKVFERLGSKENGLKNSQEFQKRYRNDLKTAFENAKDIARIYRFAELGRKGCFIGIKGGFNKSGIFTPKKFAKGLLISCKKGKTKNIKMYQNAGEKETLKKGQQKKNFRFVKKRLSLEDYNWRKKSLTFENLKVDLDGVNFNTPINKKRSFMPLRSNKLYNAARNLETPLRSNKNISKKKIGEK